MDTYVGIRVSDGRVRARGESLARSMICSVWTIPRGSVREREMDTYVGISVTDIRDRNKGFRALGGNPPKG